MNILVTGGAGFIGSHTVVELLNKNYKVIVVDNFCNSKREVVNKIKEIAHKDFIFYEIDVCDAEKMEEIFKNHQIDCVIHFAALKSGADSIRNPGLYYSNNLQSTYVLVTLMEKYNVKKLIFSSSATVYGNSKNVPILETEIIGNVISPYGMTKYLIELYLNNKANSSKNFKVISFRYFNPIGAHPTGLIGEDSPDETPNNLMLYMLKVANRSLPYLNIFGNDYQTSDGTGIRDFIHVVDLALGHIAAIDYFDKMSGFYDVFNLGTGKGYTVMQLVHAFEDINGVKIPCKVVGRRPGDVEISYASVEKAKKILNWKANYSIEDCVKDAWNFAVKKNA